MDDNAASPGDAASPGNAASPARSVLSATSLWNNVAAFLASRSLPLRHCGPTHSLVMLPLQLLLHSSAALQRAFALCTDADTCTAMTFIKRAYGNQPTACAASPTRQPNA